jgi:hypothetical protein
MISSVPSSRCEMESDRMRQLALARRERVTRADPAQLAAQASERPPPLPGLLRPRRGRLLDQRLVLGGDRLRHPACELTLLRCRGKLADPDRRLATRLADLVCEPLQLLAVARIVRQRRQPVQHLHGAEPAQLAPQSAARRRRVARQPVGEQHPRCPARRHPPIMTDSATAVAQLAAGPAPGG